MVNSESLGPVEPIPDPGQYRPPLPAVQRHRACDRMLRQLTGQQPDRDRTTLSVSAAVVLIDVSDAMSCSAVTCAPAAHTRVCSAGT
jgi:hypothetical protein